MAAPSARAQPAMPVIGVLNFASGESIAHLLTDPSN
jgi:hypothetical protein